LARGAFSQNVGSLLLLAPWCICQCNEPRTTRDSGTPASAKPAAGTAAAKDESRAGFPKTCDDAATRIEQRMTPELRKQVRGMSKDQLIILHASWGQGIRNEYGLWRGNQSLLTSCAALVPGTEPDPDSVSMILMEIVWGRLQLAGEGGNGDH